MDERRELPRHRSLLGGKILFNDRRSVIDCLVRNLSDGGANLQVETTLGLPHQFGLLIGGEERARACTMIWSSEDRVGVEFSAAAVDFAMDLLDPAPAVANVTESDAENVTGAQPDLVRTQLLTLRAALDDIQVGIVLLDEDTHAQFINRAFRRMWRLPDEIAERKPPFVALMYHGRDTRAYAVPPEQLDAYIAERVALIRAGDPRPLDLRLTNGEVVRLTCTMLPAGGRMLCYTYVTDIVRHSDELQSLRAALDDVSQGVLLLDAAFNVRFMNRAGRKMWAVTEAQIANGLSFVKLALNARDTGMFAVPSEQIGQFVADRIALIKAGDPAPVDIPHRGGRVLRAQCTVLPNGGRMICYSDVTDLVQRAQNLERLAKTDSVTGIFNRREFGQAMKNEWNRFQRYYRPLALLMIDLDGFKEVNREFGHDAGDRVIMHVATLCNADKRASDTVARVGADEFALLLPETDDAQAMIVAERLRARIAETPLVLPGVPNPLKLTVSIGHAQASLSMAAAEVFYKIADTALYKAKAAGRNQLATATRAAAQVPMRAAAE